MKGLSLGTGAVFLATLGWATSQSCWSTPYAQGTPQCHPGEKIIFETRYSDGQNTAWCCPPGSYNENQVRAKATGCRTTSCKDIGTKDTCETLFGDYWYQGKKMRYEEVKRENCTRYKKDPGEATYCCRKGSLESSLATLLAAETNEFPHIAVLNFGGDQCGGTIYNKRYILTAAHCVYDNAVTKLPKPVSSHWSVKVGRNVIETPMRENDYKIVETIPHPGYSRRKGKDANNPRGAVYNDLAFVEVDRDITFGPYVKSLRMAPKGFDELKYGDKAIIAGWGTTDTNDLTDNLQKANVIIRSDEACYGKGAPYIQYAGNTEKVLCLGGILEGIWNPNAGKGDSGGPAICRDEDGFPVLCGLASTAGDMTKCIANDDAESCLPNTYAEVDNYVDWIKETAGEQDPSTFYKPQLYGKKVSGSKVDHQVRITSASGKSCGGTLIAPDTVVTAAHCIVAGDGSGKMLSGLQVWSEVRDISSPASQGASHSVKGVTTLDGFKMVGTPVNIAAQGNRVSETDNFYSNNLGVIKLKDPVNISPRNLPKLPGAGELASSPAQELAFPRNTSRGGELRQRVFTILDKTECQMRMDRLKYAQMASKVEDNILCGVEKYSGGSTCDRELGGGLICKGRNGKETLCGVQVHRYCEWNIPNYFIDVGKNSGWIEAAKAQL